jgi:hypothetical protein
VPLHFEAQFYWALTITVSFNNHSMKVQSIYQYGDWKLLHKTGYLAIKEIQGTIIRVKYMRTIYSNLLLQILHSLRLLREYKEIIYWNPYKATISSSNKYSDIGPNSRGVHAKVWFQVDEKDEIYTKFSDKFIHGFTLPTPFPGTHLKRVTSKRLISTLDDILYHK